MHLQQNFEDALALARDHCENEIAVLCLWALYSCHVRLGDAFNAAKCFLEAEAWNHSNSNILHLESELKTMRTEPSEVGSGGRAAVLHLKLGDCYAATDSSLANQHYQVNARAFPLYSMTVCVDFTI